VSCTLVKHSTYIGKPVIPKKPKGQIVKTVFVACDFSVASKVKCRLSLRLFVGCWNFWYWASEQPVRSLCLFYLHFYICELGVSDCNFWWSSL